MAPAGIVSRMAAVRLTELAEPFANSFTSAAGKRQRAYQWFGRRDVLKSS
jgi:hypothetical protein